MPPRERVIEGRHTTPAPAAPTAWSSPTSWLPGDLDPDGIWIGDHTRTLKLDQDDSIVNEHDVAPRPDHRLLDTHASHRVDPRPRIVDVSVVSSPATTSDTYVSGESIRIAVRYNQGVTVDGDPEFEFSLSSPGAAAGTGDRRAAYDAGASSANSLVFTYTVLPTDEDPNGIWIGNHTRTLKLDTDDKIRNPHGADARSQHPSRNTLSGHKVDGDRNIATLSDLALADRRAAGVSLAAPLLRPSTTSYRAEVGRAVDRVTVTATPTNPDADLGVARRERRGAGGCRSGAPTATRWTSTRVRTSSRQR